MAARLKLATAPAHQRLEDRLGLLARPLAKARFVRTLSRFYGFHLVWEEAVAGAPGLGALMAGRSRLRHLRADLRALGVTDPEVARIERCEAARGLAALAEHALGSAYVVEGSALGGQVISRALADAAWSPHAGLAYFNPYGPSTGAMWRSFKASAAAICRPGLEPLVEAGAIRTFELLTAWLAEPAHA